MFVNQLNATNLNSSKTHFQLEVSLAQLRPAKIFNLLKKSLNHNLKMYQNNKGNLSNTEISQLQKTHYKSPCNWIKSSVSSMISAEEGQPPSNEPDE